MEVVRRLCVVLGAILVVYGLNEPDPPSEFSSGHCDHLKITDPSPVVVKPIDQPAPSVEPWSVPDESPANVVEPSVKLDKLESPQESDAECAEDERAGVRVRRRWRLLR